MGMFPQNVLTVLLFISQTLNYYSYYPTSVITIVERDFTESILILFIAFKF